MVGSVSGRACCRRCGGRLRLGQTGELCGLCARKLTVAELLPEGFFTSARMRAALAGLDFATVFRSVRRETGFSQQRLGELVELPQERVSLVERRTHQLRDIRIIVRVATQFGISAELLGFGSGAATVGKSGESGSSESREVDWMRRRDFLAVVTGITMGLDGLDGVPLDLDRLAALLPAAGVERPSRIGAADVAAIERVTAVFREGDFSRGGGLYRDAAVAQFRSVLALREVSCTPQVRAQLLVATADLGGLAAWMSYDSWLQGDARQLWIVALEVARQAEHPAAVDRTVDMLSGMVHQALHLRRLDEAQRLVQLGHATVAGGAQSVSAGAVSLLAINQAWCDAARGDAVACDRAVGRSVELLATPEPVMAAGPWATHVDHADLAGRQGHAYFHLAAAGGSPRQAARAVPLLEEAVREFGPAYARSRAVKLPGLSGSHVIAGDLDAAVAVGRQAVIEITALSSRRGLERLRTLDTILQPHDAEAAVTDLREQIRGALTAA